MTRLTPKEIARGRALVNGALPGPPRKPPPSAFSQTPEFAAYIKRVVDAAPPLSRAQLATIGRLLSGARP